MLVDIRQLGWHWRYTGRNCCSEIVKRSILTTEISINPALIFKADHNEDRVLNPTSHPCYNVLTQNSSFRYINIRSELYLIMEFDRTQIVLLII
jgi:hypothetical protein